MYYFVLQCKSTRVANGRVLGRGTRKHASNVPGCAHAIEKAGYPEQVFQTLRVGPEQVDDILAVGATVGTGREPLDRGGAFYPQTVLTGVPRGCPADSEELFGPVATAYEVEDEREAVELANDTAFGLGASI